ncbi:alpha/beta fold hydrolase [Salinisphaera sp. Q1T1-3]|uniref:bifunctional 3-oxoadipate enol-lactonase/4-carboxymuconolactone decarboxylase PcaDC n=1 Tax=Salinisphaera sp. Q1T1-3 TaxID=2321229 RepID=UPI000E72DF27|nr:alpha/beta fold hydrolase [Salinisphaera sp. Q1T1-3]RJS91092.1 alpha/beta fold hydrolase [Salinisphaera sp. Q1T1-3]
MPFIQHQGRAIAYRDNGAPTAPPVLLVHPLGMSQGVWDAIVARLSHRFRLISWDLPGHGASAAATGPITAEDMAHDALALLDALGIDRTHVVATSIGGVIAQALLVVAPERLQAAVLTNTGTPIGTREAWHERAARVREQRLPALAETLSGRWFAPAFVAAEPATLAGWQTQLARTDAESYARCCELLAAADFRGRLDAFTGRVALVTGADDVATPPAALQAMAGEFRSAEVAVLDGVGHVSSVEAPERLARIVIRTLAPAATEPPVAYADGLAIRKSVLGEAHVARSTQNATAFDAPFQDFITRNAWGELWGNPDLSHRQRSLITTAILAALGRDGELELHLKTAHRIGITEAELRQALMHVAIYAGVPAANHAFKLARQHGWGEAPDTATSQS